GPITACIDVSARAPGCPSIRRIISLHAGVRRIDCAVRILKNADPLGEASVAFPFDARAPRFRYEGVLGSIRPGEDTLPGASLNTVAVQNWLSLSDAQRTILWSCAECPIVSLGDLWPSRVSPAHTCALPATPAPAVTNAVALGRGWVFSRILANNFGTNFSVSQTGDFLFRYAVTSADAPVTDTGASWFGWEAVTPLSCITTSGPAEGPYPPCGGLAEVDSQDVEILASKLAEEGGGLVVRLWNHAGQDRAVQLTLSGHRLAGAEITSMVEEGTGEALPVEGSVLRLVVPASQIVSVRLRMAAGRSR
ncbi:MAG TPA: hypothetical protein VFH83_13060, partial [Spirochaetia bacterium]|nr:hypothetical protein [Spirochaetia bacterium]